MSVCLFICVFVDKKMSILSETARAVYGLYLLRTSQKSKNISFYMPHERERTSGSQKNRLSNFFGFVKVALILATFP